MSVTIASTPSEVSYAGNGVTLAFAIPFVFDTSADIKVIETDEDGNAQTVTTGFSITGGLGSMGTLTYSVAPATGVTITILDDPELTQPVDYTDNDSFPAETHEGALDRLTRICKRLAQLAQKSVRVADGDPAAGDGMELGSVDNRKGKYLFFNAVTGAIEYAVALTTTALSQSIVAQLLHPQTDAESDAGVVPTNYSYIATEDTFPVERYGASTSASASANLAAINAALSIVYQRGGGTITFDALYSIGNNRVRIYDQGNFGNASSSVLEFRGNRKPHFSRADAPSNCGITGTHASGVVGLGDGTTKCSGHLAFRDFAVIGAVESQSNVLNLLNDTIDDPHVIVDLDYVLVMGIGASTTILHTGKTADSNWNNVYVASGVGTQADVGVRIFSEAARMVNGQIRYCNKGVFVPGEVGRAAIMDSTWILQCDGYGVYFEAPDGEKTNRSSFTNCFIGEAQGTAEDMIAVYAEAGGFECCATFVGTTFDRSATTLNGVIHWLTPGTLTLLGCTNARGLGNTNGKDIRLGVTASNLAMVGCNRWTIDPSSRADNGAGLFLGGNEGVDIVERNAVRFGSWTPALTFGGSATGVTYSTQVGSYERRGDLVVCDGAITLTSNGSGSGAAVLTGLPFNIANNLSGVTNIGVGAPSLVANFGTAGSIFSIAGIVNTETAAIKVTTPAATSSADATESDLTNTFAMRFQFVYRTDEL